MEVRKSVFSRSVRPHYIGAPKTAFDWISKQSEIVASVQNTFSSIGSGFLPYLENLFPSQPQSERVFIFERDVRGVRRLVIPYSRQDLFVAACRFAVKHSDGDFNIRSARELQQIVPRIFRAIPAGYRADIALRPSDFVRIIESSAFLAPYRCRFSPSQCSSPAEKGVHYSRRTMSFHRYPAFRQCR